jgi:hypothetical protein
MSRIALSGNSLGTGTLTISAPNTNVDRVLDLPDSAGTLDTIQRAGNVLQVVSASTATGVTNSTSTYADTGLTATITPLFASSKILVLVSQNGCSKSSANVENRMAIRLLRNSDVLSVFSGDLFLYTGTALLLVGSLSVAVLDAPATTSATTYKTQFQNPQNAASVTVQFGTTALSTITLLEIAA